MSTIVVIYHRADFDGLFCRAIAERALGTDNVTYIGWDYGDPVPDVWSALRIYMLDISVKGLMDHPGLIWIDHHKSAMEAYPTTIEGFRIDGVAACRLTWQWFNAHESFFSGLTKEDFFNRTVDEPLAVRLAGEYDIWDKRDPRAELFQHGLHTRELNAWVWNTLLSDGSLAESFVGELLRAGEVLQYATRKKDESIIRRFGFTTHLAGLCFLACNAASYNSLLFAAGIKPEHDGLLGFNWTGTKWRVSLYGVPGKPNVDLAKIAVSFGGGGHKQACGFEVAGPLPFELDEGEDKDAGGVSKLEVSFPCEVELTYRVQRQLTELVDEMCKRYERTHPGRVMWPMGVGNKVNWSKADAAFLGRTAEPDAPESGEPTYDDSVFCIEVAEREDLHGNNPAKGGAA